MIAQRALMPIALLLALMQPIASATGIPVHDAGSTAQQIAAHVETIAKWKLQYDQLRAQIDQLQREYAALTGSRGFGAIADNPKLRDYLPPDFQLLYDSLRDSGYAGATGSAQAILNANNLLGLCVHLTSSDSRAACEARVVKPAQDQAFAIDALAKARQRVQQISTLQSQINRTQDPKAIAELNARIAIENAQLANEKIKVDLYRIAADAENLLQKQRMKRISMRENARRGWAEIRPVVFK